MGEPHLEAGGGLEPNPTLEPNPPEGGGGASVEEDRSFMSPAGSGIDLSKTVGFYLTLGGKNVLFVVDTNTVLPGSDTWNLAMAAIAQLQSSYSSLDSQGRAAIDRLDTVIFSTAPNRSFADVVPNRFFYDVNEFYRSDGSLISASYAASNIVHDANHIWQYDQNLNYAGLTAETAGWQLQSDNAAALGLSQYEVDFLNSLIANPSTEANRLNSPPY